MAILLDGFSKYLEESSSTIVIKPNDEYRNSDSELSNDEENKL